MHLSVKKGYEFQLLLSLYHFGGIGEKYARELPTNVLSTVTK